MNQITAGPIRVALVGYGYSGKTFHAPLIRAVAGLEVRLVSSRDEARVRADLPEAIVLPDPIAVATSDEVELVVIASPNDSHAPLARAALSAGKHVVVDKPFTLDLAEARDLVALAADRGRLLSVFHNRRWDSDFLTVKRAIEDGEVGTVTHFESAAQGRHPGRPLRAGAVRPRGPRRRLPAVGRGRRDHRHCGGFRPASA